MYRLLIFCVLCVCVGGYRDGRCQTRRTPYNGQVSYTVRDGGLVARFRCHPGYKLSGSPFAVCLEGIWRHSVPHCLPKQHVDDSATRKAFDTATNLLNRKRSKLIRLEQNDSPQPVTSRSRKYRKTNNNHVKKKKEKRKLKQKGKAKGNMADGQQLEQDVEFLSKLDLSCLIGSGGAGFIKAPEVAHAVVKYARKRNENGIQNRYLLATYDCLKGYTLKNKRNDRMFCSQSRWLGVKPRCQKQEALSEPSLCNTNRGGCEHVCTEIRRKVVCSCYHGFRSEGNRCIDIDECEINNGGCEHICKNHLGSYSCQCPTGLQLSSNGKTCLDINECLSRNGHGPCQDTCTNHWGGYQCSCGGIPGTQLSDDNHTCEVIDECKSGAAGCSHSCISALGRAFCQCPPGLELGEDWKTCQDIDECDDEAIESTCEYGCINTVGSYHCASSENVNEIVSMDPDSMTATSCSAGYRSDSEGKCIDIDECSENTHNCSHECINRDGDYECACPDGYDLSENERTCDDYDECAEDIDPEHNCSQICINEIGSYRCGCYKGYMLDADQTSCIDIDECSSSSNPCSHECKNLVGGFHCVCPEGYQTKNLTDCVDIDECLEGIHNCTHGCTNLPGSYECVCPQGFIFSNDSCIDVDECDIENGNCTQLCINHIGSRECKCQDGYYLVNETECVDIDECTESMTPCTHGCENTPGSYSCLCPDGFTLELGACEDLNECLYDNGNCSHFCQNHEGGYECDCPSGYQLEGMFDCVDLDECETENGGCSSRCVNTAGSYQCQCDDGYLLDSDHKNCKDIDECSRNNGNCSHSCLNSEGGYSCVCPENYELQTDNRTCSIVDLCLIDNGGCDHNCTMVDEEKICSCFEGYYLDSDNKTCKEEDKCAMCDQICENGICYCKKGYRLAEDQRSCVDVDECENTPCPQICINVDGGYECDCHDGYRLNDRDNKTCLDVDECFEWEYDIEYYDNKLDYGEPRNLCSHTCVNLPGGYTCYCPEGYRLSEDDRTCVDVNECERGNGGCDNVCINYDGGYACQCKTGYLLTNGTSCIDIDECSIGNGGCLQICENTHGGFSCNCYDGYVLHQDNRTCQRKCSIKNGLCSDICADYDGEATCDCLDGFRLLADNLTCADINECDKDNGGCQQICKNSHGRFECLCYEGYIMEENNCALRNECIIDNGDCSHNCHFEMGVKSCSCPEGYNLHEDNKTCICPTGYFDMGQYCRDIDECQEEISNCSYSCLNTLGSYKCECPSGFELAADAKTCVDIDECSISNGGCSQDCVNTIGSHHCQCQTGFTLVNATNCVLSNLCEKNNGGCEQVCKTKFGKIRCSCHPGYVKNGTFCNDVNECDGDHDCSQLCVNTQGSYECKCKVGYRSDGKNCTDIDECNLGACYGKKCVNTMGSYYCECHSGYKLINDQCIDINECITQRPCRGRCINTIGSYKCVCHTGFKDINGVCSDINECVTDNGGCSHICINFQGSYKCLCPAGYELHNKTCIDINECNLLNGGCDHTCINTEGSYKCMCKDHFYLLDDQKTCRVAGNACPKLLPPPFGEIRCPQFTQSTQEFPIYSECYVRCHKGYKFSGDSQRICTPKGEWSGRIGECIPLPCPKLKTPDNGHFIPSSCTSGKIPPSHHCILACNKGYHVQGRAVLTCLTSQQWNSPIPTCGKDTPPPYIQCSPDIKIELPSKKLSVYVRIPQPKSNVDWWRYVEAHPPWAKKLEGEFQLGTTTIMFQARNPTSNLTAACRLLIHVYDNEKPRVTDCPESFIVRLSPKEAGKVVTWKEPTFSDNVKIEHIHKSREPGSLLRPGYHPIHYIATDTSGNKASCNFTIGVIYEDRILTESKDPLKKVIICPHSPVQGDFYPSYAVSARCFVQRHRLTRVLSGFADYQSFQNHGVRHQHDHVDLDSRFVGTKNYYNKKKEKAKDETKPNTKSDIYRTGYANRTVVLDTQVLIDQKNHQSDLSRWQDIVKRYRMSALPPLTSASHEKKARLLEMETKRRFEEERLRNHEQEMMKWRENMKKYHLEIKRLQEDSRRYRAG